MCRPSQPLPGGQLPVRYIAEYTEGEGKAKAANSAKDAYDDATKVASTDLVVTHPIRLGLALNFSVFHYEVLNNPEEACKMARQAFEDAIAELDSVSEDSSRRGGESRGGWSATRCHWCPSFELIPPWSISCCAYVDPIDI